jgi:hypothetical protein
LEKLGKPVVFVVPDHFVRDARSSAEDNGMRPLRLVTVPAEQYYSRRISVKDVEPVGLAATDDLVAALTRPLSAKEEKPEQKKIKPSRRIKIRAEDYENALEKFNQHFLDNHWGSGLPLIPPTPKRVKWMLQGTKRSPRQVLGTVPPKNGIATIEKVAINAVMAGARPEYLPVIIAAMEGFLAKDYDLLHMNTSSGSFFPMIVINGPVARAIDVNAGIGFLGHGWRANNTIGHALRLSLSNIGHVWPAENDMALVGRLSPHTFFTFAENEDISPWQPYHVSRGYKREDSAVTVSTIGSYRTGLSTLGGGAVETWSAQQILERMVAYVDQNRKMFGLFRRGQATPPAHPHKFIFVIHPELATELNRLGYTREDLQKYLYEETSVPYENLSPEELQGIRDRIEASIALDTLRYDVLPADRIPVFQQALKPGGKVPVVVSLSDIVLLVAGGVPGYTFATSYLRVSHETRLVSDVRQTGSLR